MIGNVGGSVKIIDHLRPLHLPSLGNSVSCRPQGWHIWIFRNPVSVGLIVEASDALHDIHCKVAVLTLHHTARSRKELVAKLHTMGDRIVAANVLALAHLFVMAEVFALCGTVSDGPAPQAHSIAHHRKEAIFVFSTQLVTHLQHVGGGLQR